MNNTKPAWIVSVSWNPDPTVTSATCWRGDSAEIVASIYHCGLTEHTITSVERAPHMDAKEWVKDVERSLPPPTR